jgi:nardilysin
MEVIGLLYQYLKMLRSVGPQEWVFKEQKAVSTLNFQFPEEGSSDEYAINLASKLSTQSKVCGCYSIVIHVLQLLLIRFTQ